MSQAIWNKAYQLGFNTRSSNQDGLAAWKQFLKQHEFSKTEPAVLAWKPAPVRLLPIPEIQSHKNVNADEYEHFLIQINRLPGLTANRARIYQMAYNIGQAHALGDSRHSKEMLQYVKI